MNDQNPQHQAALDEYHAAVDALRALEAQIEAAKDRVNRAADKLVEPGQDAPNNVVQFPTLSPAMQTAKEVILYDPAQTPRAEIEAYMNDLRAAGMWDMAELQQERLDEYDANHGALVERHKMYGLDAIQIDITDLQARLAAEGAEAVMADLMRQAIDHDAKLGGQFPRNDGIPF